MLTLLKVTNKDNAIYKNVLNNEVFTIIKGKTNQEKIEKTWIQYGYKIVYTGNAINSV